MGSWLRQEGGARRPAAPLGPHGCRSVRSTCRCAYADGKVEEQEATPTGRRAPGGWRRPSPTRRIPQLDWHRTETPPLVQVHRLKDTRVERDAPMRDGEAEGDELDGEEEDDASAAEQSTTGSRFDQSAKTASSSRIGAACVPSEARITARLRDRGWARRRCPDQVPAAARATAARAHPRAAKRREP